MQRICLQCRRPGFDPWVGKIPWRREWQHTPIFLPGEFHRHRSLVVYSPWDCRVGHNWRITLSHTQSVQTQPGDPKVYKDPRMQRGCFSKDLAKMHTITWRPLAAFMDPLSFRLGICCVAPVLLVACV